ncbi:MAG TPA: ATP-binding protein [Candidatus Thermoplasmatota archaeon]|nr:ATP-binding protein [Candidatus Thermoplasmatota archaeon]
MAAVTAKTLLEQQQRPRLPRDVLRDTIRERLSELRGKGHAEAEAYQTLFPRTILDDDVLEVLTASLLSGANLLVLGPPGSGKTSLAKDVWELFPKEVLAVEGCPVQDDPFSLIDRDFARLVPPCPYCRVRHGGVSLKTLGHFDPAAVDPASVPVAKIRLREGYGLARIQGSPEVFPDNLTGTINLAKLEEIGDPTSPLVFEPGKLLQANRGLLLIDEIGKLPRGTQNVLLQALQENIVSPAKTRETFPASFVAITTSNLGDLDNVNEPLSDRLANLHVPFNRSPAKNRRIVDMALAGQDEVWVSGVLRDAAVVLVQDWRRAAEGVRELDEVGSNRAMVEILRRSASYALLDARAEASSTDFRRGAADAMRGRIRARGGESWDENRATVDAFLERHWKEAGRRAAVAWWCGFFENELKGDKAEAERVIREARETLRTPESAQKALAGDGAKTKRLAGWVRSVETSVAKADLAARTRHVFRLLEDFGTFERTDWTEQLAAAQKA